MNARIDGHAKRARLAPSPLRQRLDKWLWAARFYKTRSLAAQAIDAGHVRAGAIRVKPAHLVKVSERISVRKSGFTWEVEVTALSERRGGAAEAALLYRETAQSAEAREQALQQRKAALAVEPRFGGRPTKRERRKLADFLNEP
jgi:ribosome-associated heat shock protein Hsp15